MSQDTSQLVVGLLFLAFYVGALVFLFWPKPKAKQPDPWEHPEPEHQGPWGNSEMRGDSTHGD